MKNITINLPETYVKLLDKLAKEQGTTRSKLLRIAIDERLNRDLMFTSELTTALAQVESDVEYIVYKIKKDDGD